MKDGVRFQFPAAQPPHGVGLAQFRRIDALDIKRSDERAHRSVQLLLSKVPELNGQGTAKTPQYVDTDPSIGEVFDAAAANHNPTSMKIAGIGRDRLDEFFRGAP